MKTREKHEPTVYARAAKEMLARRRSRDSMRDFARYMRPDYAWAWFHDLIFDAVDDLVRGDTRNLAVFMPPQHGKSTIISHLVPAYMFGRAPSTKIVAASYGASLAQRNSREVQRIIDSESYARLFPDTRLNSRNIKTVSGTWLRNVEIFETVEYGGAYKCAGVGGALTGFTGDVGLIDDPYKDYADGSSPTVREAVWEWCSGTFFSRLHKDSRKVLIQTRWHPDDAWARIKDIEGDAWREISLPALCIDPNAPDEQRTEVGEALWPAKHDRASLEAKRLVNPHQFEALYQQQPRMREGGMFDRASLEGDGRERIIDTTPAPRDAPRVRRWDLAASSGKGDWTVGVLMARHGDTYIVEDVRRVRLHTNERNRLILDTAKQDRDLYGHVKTIVPEDPGSAGKDVARYLVGLLSGFPVDVDRESKAKELRAEPFSDQVRGGNVRLVRGPWVEEFIAELEMFPGAHDDQVDAASGAFLRLSNAGTSGNVWSLADIEEEE